MRIFSEIIRKKRTYLGYTLRKLAKDMGVSAGYISKVENRLTVPSPKCTIKFADKLSIDRVCLIELAKEAMIQEIKHRYNKLYDTEAK